MRILFLIVMLLAQPVFAEQDAGNKRFDIQAALKEGYSKAEIADYLASQSKFDIAGARKEGYSDDEILAHLTNSPGKPLAKARPDLSKVPKWRDIAAKPEFQSLPPEKQAEAKAAYFDHWIAPHVAADGKNVAEVRTEFLRQLGKPNDALTHQGSRFEVTSPDGRKFEITAPDGASQDDVLAYAQEQFSSNRALLSDEDVFGKRPSWGQLGWPHYVVLGIAVLGIAVLIRTLRTRMPSPAIPPKTVTPAGGSRMNDRQRKILSAAATLIGLMFLYPPYQLHTGYGLGYSWLFLPPEDYAIINASQLLVQWVAVLLIGGIAFALSGPVSVAATMNPAPAPTPAPETIISAPQATPANSGLAPLYEAAIGEKSRAYYLTKFEAFDQFQPGLRPSWNWAAFLVGGVWALYRKMYGWFFAFWGVELATQLAFKVFLKLGSPGVGLFVFFVPWIAFSVYANALYHRNVKKKIAVAQFSIKDESQLIEHLCRKGGVHTWVIWLFGLVPLLGIVAAVVIPMLARQ